MSPFDMYQMPVGISKLLFEFNENHSSAIHCIVNLVFTYM